MKRNIRIAAAVLAGGIALGGLTACSSDADQVSYNLSQEAEQFRVERQIVFYNGVTDKIIAQVDGTCSIDSQEGIPGRAIAVTCRVGTNEYTKDIFTMSDNVTIFVTQTSTKDVSRYHKEFIIKPENAIPDIKIETGQQ